MELACSICSPFNGVKSGLKCGIYPLVIHSRRKKAFLIEGILKMYENHLLAAMKNDLALEKTSATWSRLLTPTSGLLLIFFPALWLCLSLSKHTDVQSAVIYIYWSHELNSADGKEVQQVRLCFHSPSVIDISLQKKRKKRKVSRFWKCICTVSPVSGVKCITRCCKLMQFNDVICLVKTED